MSRTVDTAIVYALSVTEKGVKQAVALTKDLGASSKVTQTAVDTSMKAVAASYKMVESIAVKADQSVARSAVDASTVVNKALDAQIAKLREAGSSYTAIMAKQRAVGASAAELAASIKRSSESEIASMRAVHAEAERTVRQRLSMATSGFGGRVAGVASGAAGVVGGATIGALGVGGALAYGGLERSRGVIEGTLAIHGATGLSQQQSLALATIATSLGIAPRSIGQAFGTLGGRTTQALAGNATSGALFSSLGISRATVAQNVNNPLALFDMVTQRAATLPATQQAAVQRSLLGRGSTIVGQLTAGGSLAESVATVQKDIPGLDPKKLIAMQEAFVHLKEVTVAFELSFAQAFGPAIGKGLQAIIPLLKPIATGFQDAFNVVKGVATGPVGQAIGKFGQMAFDAGKKLVEAFKPAMPFFSNVLLPLIKGVAIGIGVGLIGAINLLTAGVKILAPIFGAVGTALAPVKDLIERVGVGLGILVSGGALKFVAEGFAAVAGEVPLAGKALELLLKPVEYVGKGIEGLYSVISGTFRRVVGAVVDLPQQLAGPLSNMVAKLVGTFAALPDAVGGVFSSIGNVIGQALVDAVNVGIGVINSGSGLINSFTSAVGLGNVLPTLHPLTIGAAPAAASNATGSPAHGGTFRNGGLAFNGGGLVPAMVSPGEMIVHGGMAATVPGPRTAADSVFAMLPAGAAVITGSGQAMLGAGASLGDALAMQAPHFAGGGTVNALGWNVPAPRGSRGSGGPKATMRYVNHLPVGLMTTPEWQAYQHAHPKAKAAPSTGLSHYGIPGLVGLAEGGGFTGENAAIAAAIAEAESGGDVRSVNTAGNSPPSRDRGLWQFNDYWNKDISDAVSFDPFLAAQAAYKVFRTRGFRDWVTYTKGAYRQFLPAAEAALHSGVAPITSGSPLGVLAAAAKQKVGIPTLSNLIPSLTGQAAFAGGYQAGLAGTTLTDTLRSGVLSSLIGDVAITKGSSPAIISASVASAGRVASAASYAGGKLVPPGAKLVWNRIDQGQDITTTPGGPLLAMGAGKIIDTPNNPGGFGFNYPVMSYTTGPFARRSVYYGHTHSVLGSGASFQPGQVISKTGFGTSREGNATVPGWAEIGFWPPGGMNAGAAIAPTLHRIMGMRGGGIIGKGIAFHPKITKRVNPLAAPLGLVGSLLGRDDSTDVSSIIQAIAAQLDDVHAQTLQSLISLASNLARHSIKGLDTIQQRRLSTTLNLVDAAIGNRIGLAVAGAQNALDAISRQNAHKTAMATLAGVDPSSSGGLALTVALDKATVGGLNAQIGVLNKALATAKKYGDKATIKDVADKLNTALGNLDSALVTSMNDWKAAVEAAAQNAVDASSQSLSLAQGGQQILSLQQQIAGTDQTPGGGQQMAAYITSTIIPALQKQFAAQQADQAAAASVNDPARVNADILAEQQTQTALLQAQLDAQNAIKNTSQQSATALKQAGGQLAFNFHGQTFTDRLAGIGVGT